MVELCDLVIGHVQPLKLDKMAQVDNLGDEIVVEGEILQISQIV